MHLGPKHTVTVPWVQKVLRECWRAYTRRSAARRLTGRRVYSPWRGMSELALRALNRLAVRTRKAIKGGVAGKRCAERAPNVERLPRGAEEAAALARSTQCKVEVSAIWSVHQPRFPTLPLSGHRATLPRVKEDGAGDSLFPRCWCGANLARHKSRDQQVSFLGVDRPNHVTG